MEIFICAVDKGNVEHGLDAACVTELAVEDGLIFRDGVEELV